MAVPPRRIPESSQALGPTEQGEARSVGVWGVLPQRFACEGYSIAVTEAKSGWRLDKFLAESVPDLSRSRMQALLAEGAVTNAVTGRVLSDASAKVKTG